MSALMDRLLDSERLADIARNDALAGIAPPPVEMDAAFFERADMAYALAKRSGELDRRRLHRAHEAQQQRLGEVL